MLGQLFVHTLNVLLSSLGSIASEGANNPCSLYFLNIAVDTTIGASNGGAVAIISSADFALLSCRRLVHLLQHAVPDTLLHRCAGLARICFWTVYFHSNRHRTTPAKEDNDKRCLLRRVCTEPVCQRNQLRQPASEYNGQHTRNPCIGRITDTTSSISLADSTAE